MFSPSSVKKDLQIRFIDTSHRAPGVIHGAPVPGRPVEVQYKDQKTSGSSVQDSVVCELYVHRGLELKMSSCI